MNSLLSVPIWAVVVMVCLLGLIIWLWRQRTRDLRRARSVSPNLMIAPLTSLSRQQFDMLLTQAFRQRGYVIGEIATGQRASQVAADLILRKSGEYFLVHSKAWRVALVEVTAVRELDHAMRAQRAAGGFVVSSGSFTREAMGFASGRKIQLIDGRTLREMLNDTAGMPTGVPTVVSLGPSTFSKQA
ncbi:MAG: restriction endonuclease [Casimicrobium sp.]